jgi:hypothetical protein
MFRNWKLEIRQVVGVGPSQPVVIVRNILCRGPFFGLKRPFLAPKWGF